MVKNDGTPNIKLNYLQRKPCNWYEMVLICIAVMINYARITNSFNFSKETHLHQAKVYLKNCFCIKQPLKQ